MNFVVIAHMCVFIVLVLVCWFFQISFVFIKPISSRVPLFSTFSGKLIKITSQTPLKFVLFP